MFVRTNLEPYLAFRVFRAEIRWRGTAKQYVPERL
jgi:hypothetical protein